MIVVSADSCKCWPIIIIIIIIIMIIIAIIISTFIL